MNKSKRKESPSITTNIHLPGNFELTKKPKYPPSIKPKKPILRPSIQAQITCSIHCKNASGFPGLSCAECKSLYHPICVGLANQDYSGYDFYCSTCQPPAGKENKPFTLGNAGYEITETLSMNFKPQAGLYKRKDLNLIIIL